MCACEAFSQIEQFAFTLGAKACKGMQNSRFLRMAQTWLHCTDHRRHAKEILFRQLGELRSMAICKQGSKVDQHAREGTILYLHGEPYEAPKSCGDTHRRHLLPRQGSPITPDGTAAGLQSRATMASDFVAVFAQLMFVWRRNAPPLQIPTNCTFWWFHCAVPYFGFRVQAAENQRKKATGTCFYS